MTESIKKSLDNAPVLGAFLVENESNKMEVEEFESPMFGKIRVAGTSEKPLFCLGDVCKSLELTNITMVRQRLNPKGLSTIEVLTNGGKQQMFFVDEGNLYKCIFQSRKAEAEKFQDWVTDEVLPTIRKTGGYGIPQSYSEALLLAANQAKQIEMQQKALERKQVENDKLVADVKRKDATIVRMKPKEVFTDAVAGSKGNCLIGECAKLITQNGYKIGEKQFFAWLRDNGYLGKKGERYNIPNQQYVGKNALFYIKKGVRTGNSGVLHTTSTTMLTPKGQIYFVNKFLGKGGLQGDLFEFCEAHDN